MACRRKLVSADRPRRPRGVPAVDGGWVREIERAPLADVDTAVAYRFPKHRRGTCSRHHGRGARGMTWRSQGERATSTNPVVAKRVPACSRRRGWRTMRFGRMGDVASALPPPVRGRAGARVARTGQDFPGIGGDHGSANQDAVRSRARPFDRRVRLDPGNSARAQFRAPRHPCAFHHRRGQSDNAAGRAAELTLLNGYTYFRISPIYWRTEAGADVGATVVMFHAGEAGANGAFDARTVLANSSP